MTRPLNPHATKDPNYFTSYNPDKVCEHQVHLALACPDCIVAAAEHSGRVK